MKPTRPGVPSYGATTYAGSTISGRGERNYLQDALVLFFELRDRKFVEIVEPLFRLYDFPDIVRGVFLKYRTLPIGWMDELKRLSRERHPKLDWLNVNEINWLSEVTEKYPGIDKTIQFPDRPGNEECEKVVDEFILNERKYFKQLEAFMTCYVSEVEAIVSNKIGPKAQNALGLDQAQVRFIFGATLRKVYEAVDRFLVRLETLSLVHAKPITPGGRPEHLAEIVSSEGRNLVDAYAPYNARYQTAKKVLEVMTSRLTDNVSDPLPPGEIMRHLNFKELWTEISQSKPELKNFQIDSVLINPIRRFPNYKLFIERLKKGLDNRHPALPAVNAACEDVIELTYRIDTEVKRQSEAEDVFLKQLLPDY